jgi:PilZ domain-containing protein
MGSLTASAPKTHGEPNVTLTTNALIDNRFLAGQSIPCRRRYPRIEKLQGVWVYWNCKGRADTSRVQDLSTGGLFIETEDVLDAGATIRLDFLVPEGQIRAKGIVRYAKPGSGLGLKLIELATVDGPRLAALMSRVHTVGK